MTRHRLTVTALLALSTAATVVHADTLFETNNPFGGFLGLNGFTVSSSNTVAGRFSPPINAQLTSIGIWLMTDDWDGTTAQTVTVTLRSDVFVSINDEGEVITAPTETILESWTTDLTVVGWNPEIVTFNSETHAALTAGANYWVVVESPVQGGMSPVWAWASEGHEFTARRTNIDEPWQSGSGAAVAMTVIGETSTPACAADLGVPGGGAGHDGVLDNNDFIAFITAFFAQNAVADMGVAGGLPGSDGAWNNNDFIAFIAAFFGGCH